MIINDIMPKESILAQNPNNPAPQDVIDALEIIAVEYLGFDDLVHAGQMVMHAEVASDVRQFFTHALQLRFPIQRVIPISNEKYNWNDEASCGDNNSSGYNYRLIAGTNRMSNHARGLAFDINPVQNMFVKYDDQLNEIFRFPKNSVYDANAPGTLASGDPLVTLMKSLGWAWGGDWTPQSGRVDYQHFEKTL